MDDVETSRLLKGFKKLVRRRNNFLGSVLNVQCQSELNMEQGVLTLCPEKEYLTLAVENEQLLRDAAKECFGRETEVRISGPKGLANSPAIGENVPPAEPEDPAEATAGDARPQETKTGPEHEYLEYMLDAMVFENEEDRERTREELRRFAMRSMHTGNRKKVKEGRRRTLSISKLAIYKAVRIIREATNPASLKTLIRRHIGAGVALSAFASIIGPFPWNWNFEAVDEFTVKGKKRMIGRPKAVIETPHAVHEERPADQEQEKTVITLVPNTTGQGEAPEGEAGKTDPPSAREAALEEEIKQLRQRLQYFEKLFTDHIHDITTGQPYQPVKFDLIEGGA